MALPPGTKLGPYEIGSPLGAGGMGEVFRARDTRLGREVAIKVLPSQVANDSEKLDRFQREAKVLASLNHPNIASIYGFEDSGKPGLVMELVEGPTLADRLLAGPLPTDATLPIAKQICDALEYAHERGVVHRDVKPANIKVTAEGAVKLLDFGLAKALESGVTNADILSSPTSTNLPTQAGIILGTAAYMSPEQAKGHAVDCRADIWAFGCVLFEMLTGKRAFSGDSVTDTLAEIIKVDPDWNLIPANTPKAIRTLIQRCLAKNAKQRLQAIGEARIVFEDVLSGGNRATAEESLQASISTAAHRGYSLTAWVGGFLLGIGLSAIGWWATRPAPAPAMHFSAVTSFAGVQAQPALSPDGRSVAFVSNRDGHFNVYVGLVRGGELVQVTRGDSLKSRPRWSPDGSTLAYSQMTDSSTSDVWEVSALGGAPRKILLAAGDPAWTPDGRSLVYENLSDGSIWTSGVSGENPRQLVPMERSQLATELSVSPDGKMVAMSVRSVGYAPYGELGVADLSTGKLRLLTHDHALALSPAWSPDSRLIYFASSRGGTLNVWKISADGSGLRQVTAGEGDDAELDVSSDGKRLVFATFRLNIGLQQLDLQDKSPGSHMKALASDPARNEFGPAYSPDGTHIAFFTNLKGAEHESIGVADANGANAVQLVRDSRVNIFPFWSPDGKYIVYSALNAQGHYDYRAVSVSGGAPQTIISGGPEAAFVGRDGRLLYQKTIGEVAAFDPRDGKEVILGRIPDGASHLRWSPDGKTVAYNVWPRRDDDPDAGIWITDFRTPPRRIFSGWADWFASYGQDNLIISKGKSDLNGELWKMKWDGSGLSRIPGTIPLLYDINYFHALAGNEIGVSPDGRYIVFQSQQVLQENIGIIDNLN